MLHTFANDEFWLSGCFASHPDIAVMVDWAFKMNYLSVLLHEWKKQKKQSLFKHIIFTNVSRIAFLGKSNTIFVEIVKHQTIK